MWCCVGCCSYTTSVDSSLVGSSCFVLCCYRLRIQQSDSKAEQKAHAKQTRLTITTNLKPYLVPAVAYSERWWQCDGGFPLTPSNTPTFHFSMARPLARLLRRQHSVFDAPRRGTPNIPLHTCHAHILSNVPSATPFVSPSASTAPRSPLANLPTTSLVATYHQAGDPASVLSVTRLPLPAQLQPDELLVRFLSSPINPSDINMVEGTYPLSPSSLPATAGNEGVAVIESVGSSVAHYQPGQWINPIRPTLGTWRQYAVLRASDVELVPEGLTVQQAAVLSVNPCTAYRLLHDTVQLEPGAVVVQNAATSAVGQSIIQIARQLQLTTINLIRPRNTAAATQSTIDHLHARGATHVVLEDDQLTSTLSSLPPAALALNGIGGASSAVLFRALKGAKNGGVHVTYGGMSKRPVTVGTGQLIFNDVTLKGFWMSRWNEANERSEERHRMREDVAAWMRQGKLRLDVEEVVVEEEGVEGIRHALQRYAEPFKMKKVVLKFRSADTTPTRD